jgi:hypothetical protein
MTGSPARRRVAVGESADLLAWARIADQHADGHPCPAEQARQGAAHARTVAHRAAHTRARYGAAGTEKP